nr:MAG TPA_asm: hypothetical protein [Caudoviricetes sp.]
MHSFFLLKILNICYLLSSTVVDGIFLCLPILTNPF